MNEIEYRQALTRIDLLIRHLRANQSASCAIADEEDMILLRLSDLKTTLKPQHHASIAYIDKLYRHYFPHEQH